MKKIISMLLVVAIALSLCACGLDLGDVVGVWVAQYTYNGNEFSVSIHLNADGTYQKTIFSNGSFKDAVFGSYSLDGKTLILYENNPPSQTEYKYRGGDFVNNGHHFSKTE